MMPWDTHDQDSITDGRGQDFSLRHHVRNTKSSEKSGSLHRDKASLVTLIIQPSTVKVICGFVEANYHSTTAPERCDVGLSDKKNCFSLFDKDDLM